MRTSADLTYEALRNSALAKSLPEGIFPYAYPGLAAALEAEQRDYRSRLPVYSLAELQKVYPPDERHEHTPCPICAEESVHIVHGAKYKKAANYLVGRCPNCWLMRRIPSLRADLVSEAYRAEDYSDSLSGKFAKGRIQRYECTMDAVAPLFAEGSGKRLLDFGCGNGLFLEAIKDLGFEDFGTDLSPGAVESAKKRLGHGRVWCGQLNDIPQIQPESFDIITLWSVITHLPDPVEQLEMLRSYLKPGGALVILTVNANSLLAKYTGAYWNGLHTNHLTFWEPATMSLALGRAGYGSVAFPPFYGEAIERGSDKLEPAQRECLIKTINQHQNGNLMRVVAFNAPPEQAPIQGVEAPRDTIVDLPPPPEAQPQGALETAIADGMLPPLPKPPPSKSPPSGLSVALMGTRGHGQKHLAGFTKLKDCHISYVCDVDSELGAQSAAKIKKITGYAPKVVQDFREMLKDESVDCVSICTPHHWHALAAIWTLQAGKHVYLEKPPTHNFGEGASLRAAAAKYKDQVLQIGTQLRSNTSLQAAGEYMRDGRLGTVELVHCIIHKDRPPTPLIPASTPPDSVHFDIWCGPAEIEEVRRSKFHYHWHWMWRFGNGALGNNGIHRIDAARIALGLQGYGEVTLSMGGRYGPKDAGETPNNQLTIQKFGDTWILQDVLGLKPKPFKGLENAVVFFGTEGTIVYRKGYAALVDEHFVEIERFEGTQQNHYENFLEAIREGDSSIACGIVEEGITSSALCHFGNISYQTGKPGTFEEAADRLRSLGVPAFVYERLEAIRENLQENGVPEEITIGDTLQMQDDFDKPIVGNPAAEEFLTYRYREGFELPEPDAV